MDNSEKDISNNLKNISEKELIKRITKSFKKKIVLQKSILVMMQQF